MDRVADSSQIRCRAWCRVDLAGGTLDIWPLGVLHAGSRTVNLAISIPVQVSITATADRYEVVQDGTLVQASTPQELCNQSGSALVGMVCAELSLPSIRVSIESGSPRGGGLGASSALTVALLCAARKFLDTPMPGPDETARLARDIEARMMGLPTGVQDHYPALLGGALEISYQLGSDRVRKLSVNLEELGAHLLVAYTGRSHFSASNNWQIIRRRLEGDSESVELFEGISSIAARIVPALEAGDWETTGDLVGQEWRLRSRLAAGISTPTIEALLEGATKLGAWGGKACGAGGGGCVVLFCPSEKKDEIAREVERLGGEILPAHPVSEPVQVEGGR